MGVLCSVGCFLFTGLLYSILGPDAPLFWRIPFGAFYFMMHILIWGKGTQEGNSIGRETREGGAFIADGRKRPERKVLVGNDIEIHTAQTGQEPQPILTPQGREKGAEGIRPLRKSEGKV